MKASHPKADIFLHAPHLLARDLLFRMVNRLSAPQGYTRTPQGDPCAAQGYAFVPKVTLFRARLQNFPWTV
jgi:hypothetical protein